MALERGLRRFETLELVRECLDPGRLETPSGRAWEANGVAEAVKGSIPAADRLELELELERSSAPSCASFAMADLCRLAASSGVLGAACQPGISMLKLGCGRRCECAREIGRKWWQERKLEMVNN